VNLQLFGHPFSSYTWKVLIALWADETPFKFRMLGPDHPENGEELRRRWPFGQFPLLVDGDRSVVEATCIIEHLQAHHPGPNRWIPDGELGRRVRFLDRVFDLRVMANIQAVIFDALRPAEHRNPADRSIARERLRTAYDWLEATLDQSPWAIGEQFTLADCAAAPSLFYAGRGAVPEELQFVRTTSSPDCGESARFGSSGLQSWRRLRPWSGTHRGLASGGPHRTI
jgi:glutathione S-transferase